ncbi:MAG TPA: 3D-(3,5/4)-trihydroxycyclohexane-1,2-dione acylhydrolase (decyclizing) [Candidatus Acidoferrales bacterium]|nr:3D-(3,5/4)-trihydroxycyclohexane-1,2-dione acylhydrolase (decyclizing) [Candidatus Acidoferrales bacterium]
MAVTCRVTTAQATIKFLKNQYVERDGVERPFFAGCFGIFGHGNVAGIGQALQQNEDFPYYLSRNEQAMVHTAVAFSKMSNRLRAFACTSSIGPGATNMVTGAATATVNRIPVLLLPGDIFVRRNVAPVLQQLESPQTQDISVNDCFKPVSRYWDRISRPEQLLTALPEAMRVMTSPAETGAVTLSMPQDVQAEALEYPSAFFDKRIWSVLRARGDAHAMRRAAEMIRAARQPLLIAGGGVIYSEASGALATFAEHTGIAVAETQAGRGSLSFDHPQCLGAMGVTGTPGANLLARDADLIIATGTRYTDFTTASKTAFQNSAVKFVNINVAEFDAGKHGGVPVVADVRTALEELAQLLAGYHTPVEYQQRVRRFRDDWNKEVGRLFHLQHGLPVSQSEVIGVVSSVSEQRDVVVCAAGSLPGDLHKLWPVRDPKGYHVEYGYSCMGYEIAGALGVKMASPEREVYVMVGDGSYLMMAQEIHTSIQEGIKLNIVVLDNHGFGSIGALSESCGSGGFGTEYRFRKDGKLQGSTANVDFVANARSLGAEAACVRTLDELRQALVAARASKRTTVTVIEVDRNARVPGYESWWDVAVAEVSEMENVRGAREAYEKAVKRERRFF